MYMNRFLIGAAVGSTLGILGAMYALSTANQKREVAILSKELMDRGVDRLKEFM